MARESRKTKANTTAANPPSTGFFAAITAVQSLCQDACPIWLNCHGYISLVKEGKFQEAYKLIRQKLPLPMTLGRVCDHPCETRCRRAQLDEAVAIRDLKRFVADYADAHGINYQPRVKSRRRQKVAVIGAGPAGLAAAYDLAREGFTVTVMDALPVAGGLMATGCPDYRLPRRILDAEIKNVTALGVEIKLNTKVMDIDSLFNQGYQAVFLAVGAQNGKRLQIPGAELPGATTAVSLLRNVSLGKDPGIGRRVVVLGGGGAAIDAARTAIRLGAEVHLACLETRQRMPGDPIDVAAAEEEGVIIHPSLNFTGIREADGRATGVECVNLRGMHFDKEGRLDTEVIEGSQAVLPADTVIFAVGQAPELGFLPDGCEVGKTGKGLIAVDADTLTTGRAGVFAGGDAATNAGSVVRAIADGQRAALSIMAFLDGQKPSARMRRADDEIVSYSATEPSADQVEEAKRRVSAVSAAAQSRRSSFAEVLATYTPVQAIEEASRCLRCDLVRAGETVDATRQGMALDVCEQLDAIRRQYQPGASNFYRRALLHSLSVHKRRKAKAENVVVFGCGVFGMALQVVSSLKLLDRLGVDYTYLKEERCCGVPQLEFGAGTQQDLENVEDACAEFANWNLKCAREIGAKRILYLCQWCAYLAKKYLADEKDVENLYFPDILLGRIESVQLSLPPVKVGYYEGCHIRSVRFAPGVNIDYKPYRGMLERVEGVQIVDLPAYKCCVFAYSEIIDKAKKMGLTCIVTPCEACWTWLEREGSKKGVRVKMLQDILVEALGDSSAESLLFE